MSQSDDLFEEFLTYTRLFEVMSLKKTDQFLPYIGLPFRMTEEVREITRQHIRLFYKNKDISSQISDSELLASTRQRIFEYNETTYNSLCNFPDTTFFYHRDEDCTLRDWMGLLSKVDEHADFLNQIAPFPSIRERTAILRIAVRCADEIQLINEKIKQKKQEPFTPWENELVEMGATSFGYWDWVSAQIGFATRKKGWQEIQEILKEDTSQLESWLELALTQLYS